MWVLALLPFFLQAIFITVDEFYFHIKRGLPLWERIGHPLDTLSVIVCMAYVLLMPFNDFHLKIYIVLALISTLLVTKDEFVHKHHCSALENWLHALLFTVHPVTLIMVALIWGSGTSFTWSSWLHQMHSPRLFLFIQTSLMSLFFLYQIFFWNIIWRKKEVVKY